MTELEYVEVVAVEKALYMARGRVAHSQSRPWRPGNGRPWGVYIKVLAQELAAEGIDGVPLRHG